MNVVLALPVNMLPCLLLYSLTPHSLQTHLQARAMCDLVPRATPRVPGCTAGQGGGTTGTTPVGQGCEPALQRGERRGQPTDLVAEAAAVLCVRCGGKGRSVTASLLVMLPYNSAPATSYVSTCSPPLGQYRVRPPFCSHSQVHQPKQAQLTVIWGESTPDHLFR
jgi:hypothetical protein